MSDPGRLSAVTRLGLLVLIVLGGGVTSAVADGRSTHPDTTPVAKPPGVGAAATGTETNDSAVTVSVEIAGEAVHDNGSVLTDDDPTLAVGVEAATRVRLVAVRVDGRTYRSYVPNATVVNRSMTLDVGAGQHEVKTVVRTENRTRTHKVVLTEDPSPPRIVFRAPFTTERDDTKPESLPDEISVDSSRVRLAGTVVDRSNVTRLEIERESYYRLGRDGRVERDRNRIVLTDINGSFARPIELVHTSDQRIPASPTGEATNHVELSVRDQFGHLRTYEFDVDVDGGDGPTITVTDTDIRYGNATATVTATVADDVGIRTAGVAGEPFSLFVLDPARQPRQATITHSFSIDSSTEVVRFTATDAGRTTTTIERAFDRSELIAPRISLDTNRTAVVERGRVRVVGTVAEGAISRVRIETVAPDGRVVDIETVHAGRIVQTVAVNETLRTSIYPVRLRVRAVDAEGEEHLRSVTVSVPPGRDRVPNATETATSSRGRSATTPPPSPASTATPAGTGVGPTPGGTFGLTPPFGPLAALGGTLADYLLIGTILLLAGLVVLLT